MDLRPDVAAAPASRTGQGPRPAACHSHVGLGCSQGRPAIPAGWQAEGRRAVRLDPACRRCLGRETILDDSLEAGGWPGAPEGLGGSLQLGQDLGPVCPQGECPGLGLLPIL